MKRLTKLDVENIGLSLYKEYCRALSKFAELLQHQIPALTENDVMTELSETQVHMLAIVINTAEYCSETLPQLAESTLKVLVEMNDDEAWDEID